ncbi:MAG: hypothetical protein HC822_23440 [Oscillochloris sp.]|nr:hypothetical protein [Oscillochloris sp.]
MTVTFAALEPDEVRSATLLFDVAETLPNDTVIDVRGTYTWEDARNGGSERSNWAPVLVGDFNNDSRYVFLEITPNSGPAGSFFEAYTDRLLPYEPVAAWFNTPDGIEPLERDLNSDAFGRVLFTFSSAGFAPGTYELVLYGQRSKLTAVQEFTVQ